MTSSPKNLPSSSDGDSTVTETSTNDDATVNSHGNRGESADNIARRTIGQGMHEFTALINDNIIAARYGVFATIGLLTIYGISKTPLFFRYRTVSEIPRTYFVGRRRLYCRIIGVHHDASAIHAAKGNDNPAIQIWVRHLSPMGILLSPAWFEFFLGLSPSKTNRYRGLAKGDGKAEDGNKRDLLKLQLAGALAPPLSRELCGPTQMLERLARKRTLISCQLLGRLVAERDDRDSDADRHSSFETNETIRDEETMPSSDSDGHQVALCRLTYRPHWQLFSTDLADALVTAGNANVASTILNDDSSSNNSFRITDVSEQIGDIRRDLNYLDILQTLESGAAQKSLGMWAVPEIREMKKDIVDEANFQANAGIFRKIWRRIRGE